MRQIYTAILFLLVLPHLNAQKTINDANAEVRQVASFHSIHVSNAFEVWVSQGSTEALAVSANDKEDVELIETEVKNGVLRIRLKEGKKGWWTRGRKLRAYVSVKTLDQIVVSGASDMHIEGTLSTEDLGIELSGASEFKGKVSASGTVNINLSGASDLDISGNAGTTKIKASGASDMEGFEFTTQSCDAHASGASSIRLSVDKEITVDLSGASSFKYKGEAVVKNISTSGSSKISKKA